MSTQDNSSDNTSLYIFLGCFALFLIAALLWFALSSCLGANLRRPSRNWQTEDEDVDEEEEEEDWDETAGNERRFGAHRSTDRFERSAAPALGRNGAAQRYAYGPVPVRDVLPTGAPARDERYEMGRMR